MKKRNESIDLSVNSTTHALFSAEPDIKIPSKYAWWLLVTTGLNLVCIFLSPLLSYWPSVLVGLAIFVLALIRNIQLQNQLRLIDRALKQYKGEI